MGERFVCRTHPSSRVGVGEETGQGNLWLRVRKPFSTTKIGKHLAREPAVSHAGAVVAVFPYPLLYEVPGFLLLFSLLSLGLW